MWYVLLIDEKWLVDEVVCSLFECLCDSFIARRTMTWHRIMKPTYRKGVYTVGNQTCMGGLRCETLHADHAGVKVAQEVLCNSSVLYSYYSIVGG